MKIGLFGYGRMGKLIHELALEQGHEIVIKINSATGEKALKEGILNSDLIIEFSRPESGYSNIVKCLELGIPVVSGTTGFDEKLLDLAKICEENQTAFFHSSNFSVGMYLFKEINWVLSKMMNIFDSYDVSLKESHHRFKKDSPSGTAVDLANHLVSALDRKKIWTMEDSTNLEAIQISSFREGDIIGQHEILYESEVDEIRLEHKAKSRFGFAHGALLAAKWVVGLKGYYKMEHMMKDLLGV